MADPKPHNGANPHDVFSGNEQIALIRLTDTMERLAKVTESNTVETKELREELQRLKDGRIADLTLSNGTMEVRVKSLEKIVHGVIALIAVEAVSGIVAVVVWAVQR